MFKYVFVAFIFPVENALKATRKNIRVKPLLRGWFFDTYAKYSKKYSSGEVNVIWYWLVYFNKPGSHERQMTHWRILYEYCTTNLFSLGFFAARETQAFDIY